MLRYFRYSIVRSCSNATGELSIPILNILLQYLFINFMDSNKLFQYDVIITSGTIFSVDSVSIEALPVTTAYAASK